MRAAGLSACRPEQRGRLGLGVLRTEIPLFPPFAFPLLALDSLWSRAPEHGAPAQPFSAGPRAGRSRRDEPGSPCSCGGPGEEKNVLLNNNAFVRKRVCVKHFLKLPRSFPGVPEAAARVAPVQPWSPRCPWAWDGRLLSPSKQRLPSFLQPMAQGKGMAVVAIWSERVPGEAALDAGLF